MVREGSSVAIRGHQRTGKLFAAAAVFVVAAALSAGGLFSGGVAASADDNSGGIGITVNVAPTDANAGSGGTGGSGSSGGGSGGSTTPSDSPSVGPSPNTTASPGGGGSVSAIVFVSGLTSRYIWSPNPLHSSAELSLTVRNVSKARFDSTARFWVTTTFGARVSEAREISVHGLKPNETRVIRATLGGLGQWTVLQAHAILTPPKMVDGTPLSPISRDAFILVPPVIVGGVGLGAAFVFVLFKFILFPRLFGIAKVFV
jgi:hypothetical protein